MTKFLISLLAFGFWLLAAPAVVFAQTATLSLDPATGTFNRGCSFPVDVKINTGSVQSDGTDVILLYDSTRLMATSITNGTIFPDYPGNNIDSQKGEITVIGLASLSTPFSGQGTVATVNFTVQSNAPTGATQVKFDFDPYDKAKTKDSNVVQRDTLVDVLNSVVDGNYTIGTGVCGGQVTPTPTSRFIGGPAGTPSAQQIPPAQTKTLPPAGSEQLTFTLAIFGGILTVLGILGLALL